MDVIVLGVYNSADKLRLNSVVSRTKDLEIVWDYDHFNIEADRGIKMLEKSYNLFDTGILLNKDRDHIFTSYPLIYEVSESVMGNNNNPKLIHFFDILKETNIRKMVIAFADEWDENTLVKIEQCPISFIKNRLNSVFVWCETYVNLISNSELRGDDHPLILEVDLI